MLLSFFNFLSQVKQKIGKSSFFKSSQKDLKKRQKLIIKKIRLAIENNNTELLKEIRKQGLVLPFSLFLQIVYTKPNLWSEIDAHKHILKYQEKIKSFFIAQTQKVGKSYFINSFKILGDNDKILREYKKLGIFFNFLKTQQVLNNLDFNTEEITKIYHQIPLIKKNTTVLDTAILKMFQEVVYYLKNDQFLDNYIQWVSSIYNQTCLTQKILDEYKDSQGEKIIADSACISNSCQKLIKEIEQLMLELRKYDFDNLSQLEFKNIDEKIIPQVFSEYFNVPLSYRSRIINEYSADQLLENSLSQVKTSLLNLYHKKIESNIEKMRVTNHYLKDFSGECNYLNLEK